MTISDKATGGASDALMFLSDVDACTVDAIAERIIPDDGNGAGASSAGVVYYIDRAVAGVSANLQPVYRRGLRALNTFCGDAFDVPFVELMPDRQDAVMRRFLGPEITGAPGQTPSAGIDQGTASSSLDEPVPQEEDTLRRLFAVIREHTIEGFFCDPVYGGNRGAVGWKLVGFPGAQWGYTAEQMAAGFNGRDVPIMTLSDLRSQLGNLPENATFYRNEGN